jgi:adenosylmethionine-8-amino-7-oxononanoate aminotransferase
MALTVEALQARAADHLLLHFARHSDFGAGGRELPVMVRGEGPYVFDAHGRRYIDALSSLFCSQLGYGYGEEMAQAAGAQLTELAFHTNWGTAHPRSIELATRLAALAPGDLNRVFFTSGGSESVETSWKLARLYHIATGEPQRTKAIARQTAYHGVTLGALAFTAVEPMKAPFGPPAIEVRHVSNTNAYRDDADEATRCARLLDEIEAVVAEEGADTIAAIIAEPVQNAGGCLVPPAGYWAGLRRICDEHGILLIADEVICAFGRLGEWFGSVRNEVVPDLLTVAKGLTSAYAPMGAVVASERVAAPLYDPGRSLAHGFTFGGHPVCAAMALRNIELFERDDVLGNVRRQEPQLRAQLERALELPIVGDVRGAGFFWALELVGDAPDGRFDADARERLLRQFLPARLLDAGVIARADDRGDSVLHIAPPLICDAALLTDLGDRLHAVLEDAGTFMGL